MKIACMQPYFLPAIQYFQLIRASDIFVFLDDVNFINKGFIHKNFIINHQKQKNQITLILKKKSQNKLINQIELFDNQTKVLSTIKDVYKKSQNFYLLFPIIEEVFNSHNKNLSELNCNLIEKICHLLEIKTRFIKSSSLEIKDLKRQFRIISILKKINGLVYINPAGGRDLYDHKEFDKNDLILKFLHPKIDNYFEKKNNFKINEISIIELLMYQNVDKVRKYLENYKLK